jgi:hypothetical protein
MAANEDNSGELKKENVDLIVSGYESGLLI